MIIPLFDATAKQDQDLALWIRRNCAVGEVILANYQSQQDLLVKHVQSNPGKIRVGPLKAIDDEKTIIELLNQGISHAIIIGNAEECCQLTVIIPEEARHRLLFTIPAEVAASSSMQVAEFVEKTKNECGGYVYKTSKMDEGEKVMRLVYSILRHGNHKPISRKYNSVVVNLAIDIDVTSSTPIKAKEVEDFVGKMHHAYEDNPINVQFSSPTIPNEDFENKVDFSIARCFMKCMKPSERTDGLYPTVVVDENNLALGMVYSNDKSVYSAIGSGRGVFWSRTRGLWRKGESSGAIQELIHFALDCDNDAIQCKVYQRGNPASFCHQNIRTCWGEESGISHLFHVLEQRKENAPAGSYTKKLFQDHQLLRSKLVEEAQELAEAVQENNPKHVTEETADVIYFAMVACVAGGSSLSEVSAELDRRNLKVKRRPGLAKDYRIAEANEILSQAASTSSDSSDPEKKKQKI